MERIFFYCKAFGLVSIFLLGLAGISNAQCPTQASVVTKTHTDISCFGANDGTITVDLIDASTSEPYNFELADLTTGTIITPSVTEVEDKPNRSVVYSNLPPGTYAVLFFKQSCTPIQITETIFGSIVVEPSQLTISASTIQPDCDPASGSGTGKIDITISGATPPYGPITWTGPTAIPDGTTSTASNLEAGAYTVDITDDNGCNITQNFQVPITTLADAGAPTGLTCGTNSFTLSGNAAGIGEIGTWTGPAGVTFSPDANTPGATANNLNAGDNTLTWTITDAGGICVGTSDNIIVTYSPPITITPVAITDVLCNGLSTGAIDITPTGGLAPYTFTWSTGATTEDISGQPAGTYSVTITDSQGCPTVFSGLVISQPAIVDATVTSTNVLCFGDNTGSINVVGTGGTAPYDFSIDGGTSFPIVDVASNLFGSLTTGTYNIQVRDANNCLSAVIPITITQPASAVGGTTTQTNVTCFGGNDGSINVVGTGGVAPYDFSIDGGATFPVLNAANNLFSTLTAGTYNIQVRDANNCLSAIIPITLTQPVSVVGGTTTSTNILCFGSNTGSINVTGTGGVAPYDFSIDGGATFPALNAASNLFGSLTAGTYNVQVRDANNCLSAIIPITLTQPAAVVGGTTTPTDVTCFGANDGSINIVGTGGVAPYDFSIDGGATFPIVDVAGNLYGSLTAGTYNLQVRDANNCLSAIIPVTITAPVAITPTITPTNILCFGDNTGSINVVGSGGTAPYDFSLDGGATFPVLNAANNLFSTLTAGTYNIQVRDANNCLSAIIPVTLTQPVSVVGGTTTSTNILCFGSNTGSINITGTGGVAPYDFSIDGGATFPVLNAVSNLFGSLTAGTYNLQVRDANNCLSAILPVTLTQPAAVVGGTTTPTNVTCFGGNDGSINVVGTGGVAPYDFSIDGGTTFSVLNAANTLFGTLTAGTYNIQVRDANNCLSAIIPITLTEPATVVGGTTTPTNISCFGGNDGSINVVGTGGTAPYDFSINGGTTFTVVDVANNLFSTLTAGTYNIQVRDANNCLSAIIPVTLTQPVAAVGGTTTPINISCFGGNDGSINVIGTGGTGPYDFSIDGGATFSVLNAANTLFGTLTAGTYNIQVRDANNCLSAIIPITLTEPATVVGGTTTLTNVTCFGGNDGSINIVGTGGVAPYDFSLDGGTTFTVLNVASNLFNTLTAGTYNLQVRDANNCLSAIIPVTLTEPATAVGGTTTPTNVTCFGGNDGSINVVGTGGTAPYDFSIDGGTTFTVVDVANNLFSTLTAGTYNLQVRDANNCLSAIIPVTLTEPATVVGGTTTPTNISCFGGNDGSINVVGTGGTGPYDFSIDGGTTFTVVDVANTLFNTLTAGTYNLQVRDANNCLSAIIPVTLTEPATVVGGTTTPTNISCFGGNNGSINVVGTGGTAPYDFSIDGGTTFTVVDVANNLFNTLTAGTYNIQVRDANNCLSAIIPVTLTEPATAVDGTITPTNISCFGGNDGSINVVGTGGTGPYDFSIDGGTTFLVVDVANTLFNTLTAGTYNVQVRDANNCLSAIIPVTLTEPATAVGGTTTITNVTCFGGNDGSINIVGTGGVAPYDFSIDGGTTFLVVDVANNLFNTLPAGTYNPRVRDANNCLSPVIPVTVTEPVQVTATISGTTSICQGSIVPVTVTFTGTQPWTFTITDGGSFTSTQSTSTNPFILFFSPPTSTTYTLVSVSDGTVCAGTVSGSAVITVNQNPDITLAVGTTIDPVCTGGVSGVTVTGSEIGVSYQLRNNSNNNLIGTSVVGNGSTITLSTGALSATTTFNVLATAPGCTAAQLTNLVTVNVTGSINAGLTVDPITPSICSGGSTDIQVVNSENGVLYQLRNDFDDSNIGTVVAGTGGTILLPTGNLTTTTVFNILASNGTCSIELTDTDTVTVDFAPDPSLAVGVTLDPLCSGGVSEITITASEVGVNYQLRNDLDDSSMGTPVAGTGGTINLSTGVLTSTTIFNILASSGGGACSAVELTNLATVNVSGTIDAALNVVAVVNPICEGTSTDIRVEASEVGVDYQLRNDFDNSNIGIPVTGTGGDIFLPTGNLSTNTTFNVLASNGTCSIELTDVESVAVSVAPDASLAVSVTLDPLCVGGTSEVTVALSEVGVTYQLRNDVDDSNIGTAVAGTGGTISLSTGILNATTTFNIFATSGGICPDVELATLATVNVGGTVDNSLTVSSSGSPICSGTSTFVQVLNSEVGVNYQLRNDATDANIGTVVPGTGGTINLPTGNLTTTTDFNVLASNGVCSIELTDKETITISPSPNVAVSVSALSPLICSNTSTSIVVASELGVSYQLRNSAGNVAVGGPVVGTGGNISLPTGNLTVNTTFNVLATVGTCSSQLTSTATVTIRAFGDPACGGGGGVCASLTTIDIDEVQPTCSAPDIGMLTFNLPASYDVILIKSDGTSQKERGSSVEFAPLAAGIYHYTIINFATNDTCVNKAEYVLRSETKVVIDSAYQITDVTCFGGNDANLKIAAHGTTTGKFFFTYVNNGQESSPLEFTPGALLPVGLTANDSDFIIIKVDESAAMDCPDTVMVRINHINPEIIATFDLTAASCTADDGGISNIAATMGGSATGPFEFYVDGILVNASNAVTGLSPGDHELVAVHTPTGCRDTTDFIIQTPNYLDIQVTPIDADCTLDGRSGKLVVDFLVAGNYQVGISTDPLTEPSYRDDPLNGSQYVFDSLSRGVSYYIFAKTSASECPTRRGPFNINGVFAVNFELQPRCDDNQLSLVLTNVTGEMNFDSGPFIVRVRKKFTTTIITEVLVDATDVENDGRIIELLYNDYPQFLQTPGDYEIQLSQSQPSSFCADDVKSPYVNYEVSTPLIAFVGPVKESYPDIINGSMDIINFSGGAEPYQIKIELIDPAVPGQSFETDWELVEKNSNQDNEMKYKNIPAGRYEVLVQDANGCVLELDPPGFVPLDTDLYIPNIFTPNGDDKNDVFFIRNLPDGGAELVISNRWGAEVYSSKNYQNNWDAEDVSDGIYFFRLKVEDGNPISGWVEVLRGEKP